MLLNYDSKVKRFSLICIIFIYLIHFFLETLNFKPPLLQFNGHLQTILPSFFRKVKFNFTRERLKLPDGDFLLLDWSKNSSKRCVIVTHGLEGDSRRHYVTGAAKKFIDNGYDALAWNCRSCGGEINSLPRFYHHGDATDLLFVIQHAVEINRYEEIVLVGFSMGGSLTLRVMAEHKDSLPSEVKFAAVASVPLDLTSSVIELNQPGKQFYMNRFLKKLRIKIAIKEKMFPGHPILNTKDFKDIKDFFDFDSRYTAPLHGYIDAADFYKKASVKPIIEQIIVPTLIVQALNDPFLTPECLELGVAINNKNLKLITPAEGGHVGFQERNSSESFFEKAAWEFIVKHKTKNNVVSK